MSIKTKCNNDTVIDGTEIDEIEKEGSLVLLIPEKGDSVECYSYGELKEWFDSGQEELYYWDEESKTGDKRDTSRKVYKSMYNGIWLDNVVYNFIIKDGFSVILLYKLYDHQIGSGFGVSQTHGVSYPIYSGIPISKEAFLTGQGDTIRKLLYNMKKETLIIKSMKESPKVVSHVTSSSTPVAVSSRGPRPSIQHIMANRVEVEEEGSENEDNEPPATHAVIFTDDSVLNLSISEIQDIYKEENIKKDSFRKRSPPTTTKDFDGIVIFGLDYVESGHAGRILKPLTVPIKGSGDVILDLRSLGLTGMMNIDTYLKSTNRKFTIHLSDNKIYVLSRKVTRSGKIKILDVRSNRSNVNTNLPMIYPFDTFDYDYSPEFVYSDGAKIPKSTIFYKEDDDDGNNIIRKLVVPKKSDGKIFLPKAPLHIEDDEDEETSIKNVRRLLRLEPHIDPEKVTTVILRDSDANSDFIEGLSVFRNITHIYAENSKIEDLGSVDIKNLPKLKEVHFGEKKIDLDEFIFKKHRNIEAISCIDINGEDDPRHSIPSALQGKLGTDLEYLWVRSTSDLTAFNNRD